MGLKSLLGIIDRLSTRSTLTGETGSIVGLIGTVGVIVIILIIYLSATIDYFSGDFYDSEFEYINLNDVE